jgi:hypothetical protein
MPRAAAPGATRYLHRMGMGENNSRLKEAVGWIVVHNQTWIQEILAASERIAKVQNVTGSNYIDAINGEPGSSGSTGGRLSGRS